MLAERASVSIVPPDETETARDNPFPIAPHCTIAPECPEFGLVLAETATVRQERDDLLLAASSAETVARARTELVARMSHELRTPINGILGIAEMLLQSGISPVQRDYLLMTQNCAEGLRRLVNDLMDHSRAESGRLRMQPEWYSPAELLAETLEPLSLQADAKRIELAYSISAGVPERVLVDPGRLKQVLINLVDNAIKFTERGSVTVTLTGDPGPSDPARLRFVVRDTGIGLDPDQRDLIFEPFRQGSNVVSSEHAGTGLGLAIARQLVEQMRGSIRAETQLGLGSTFSFTVLLPAQVSTGKASAKSLRTLAGKRLLVLDDSAAVRDALLATVTEAGMIAAGSSELASLESTLRMAASEGSPFHLLLLDNRTGQGDSFAAVERLLGSGEPVPKIIMLLSPNSRRTDGDRCRALSLGSIGKPVRPGALLQEIARVLRAKPSGRLTRVHRAQSATETPPQPLHLLLVEDDEARQREVSGFLGAQGHSVRICSCGLEAVAATETERFDAVLMDLWLPDISGQEATRRIRAREAGSGRRVPVIALTTIPMSEDQQRCRDAGMDAYLSKPVRASELSETLRGLVQLPYSVSIGVPSSAPAPVPASPSGRSPLTAGKPAPPDPTAGTPAQADSSALFSETLERGLAGLRDAVARGDASAVAANARSVSGILRLRGADLAAEAAARLERMGRRRQLGRAARQLAELEAALQG